MPETKSGVDTSDMSKQITSHYPTIDNIFQKYTDRNAVITSGRDGEHKEGSKHYTGEAIDLRTRDMKSSQIEKVVTDLRNTLGSDYDIVVEKDHIHVEYDPKSKSPSSTPSPKGGEGPVPEPWHYEVVPSGRAAHVDVPEPWKK